VVMGLPELKVHAKLCLIKKKINNRTVLYGFVSTGNMNEKTATLYGDHCLMTANKNIMADISRIFTYLEKPKEGLQLLKECKTLIPCPITLRKELLKLINREIKAAKLGQPAAILLKMNSLSDEELIEKLNEAAREGVEIKMIIRGIFCMMTENKKFQKPVYAISIIDEYLEHARVFLFHNGGKEKVFISSADWMVRNLDHRVEITCPIFDEEIQKVLIHILRIQLSDNVKARILDNSLSNEYVPHDEGSRVRSQIDTYNYLLSISNQDKKPVQESREVSSGELPVI
ncbi:MAG: phospholipase D-like domain-containing protein, partial [Chitinophagaceae bacterium]